MQKNSHPILDGRGTKILSMYAISYYMYRILQRYNALINTLKNKIQWFSLFCFFIQSSYLVKTYVTKKNEIK